MAIIQSFGALQSMANSTPMWAGGSGGSLNLYGLNQAYADIYRTQPNVRICVDFLARNIAQLGLPVYRRISDTDRERLADHDLSKWLSNPNPSTTRYRLVESLVSDLGIYFNAYWLKIRYQSTDGRDAIGLVRLPPDEVCVEGGILPSKFVWTSNGRQKDIPLSEMVYFNGYSPLNSKMGLSPLETLRRILAEEQAAGAYRESLWSHGAKHEGVIERPATAPKWTPPQRQQFREQWQEFASSAKAGMTAVLDEGMTYKPTSFSSKDSEYTAGGKLRREVCAASYHIPLPLVGILDHATFSNVKEQHKHLYQDTLGPWNEMISQEIERQLLVECADQANVYIEFNIEAKLQGSFEEQATALQTATGRPWMAPNEARAIRNLPRIDSPEMDTVAPQQGGPSSSRAPSNDPVPAAPADASAVDTAPILQAHRARQRARLSKRPSDERADAFAAGMDRWNRELAADLAAIVGETTAVQMAEVANAQTLAQLTEAADAES